MDKHWTAGIRRSAVVVAMALAMGACGSSDDNDDTDDLYGGMAIPTVAIDKVATGTVTVNGAARSYRYYLPSNLDALKAVNLKNIRIVVSFHDQGQNGEANARQTLWHELAEANGFVVIYPEAVNGTWNTTLAKDGPDELAYIQAAWADIRSKFNISDTNAVYPTGFGTGAAMAHQLAMMGPVIGYLAPISAVAGIDGVADPAVFTLPKTAYTYPATPGPVVRSPDTPFGASLPATAMSAWMITTKAGLDVTRQADYWKAQNAVAAAATSRSDRYFRTTTHKNAANGFQEVRVSSARSELSGRDLSQYLWKNMFSHVIRFKNDDRVNGTLVQTKTDQELGLIDSTHKFSEAARGDRRFLTYLPTGYAKLTAGNGTVPLVLNFHGIRGSAWWQAINTDYVPAAEKNGFIAVFPQGLDAVFSSTISTTRTVNYDVQYIVELIDHLKTKYRIDSSRIFITGVSAGAAFTNRVIVEYPQLFAGAAPCYSGHFSATVYNNYQNYPQIRTDVPMPLWQCRGGTEPDNSFPGGAAGQEASRRFWRVVVNGYADAAREEEAVPTSTATLGPDARKHVRYFTGGKAHYVWQTTDYVPHFWHPGGQADLMWTQMFSKYRRNADGTLTYTP
ncbi:CE1 family esterase [Aquincola agrisoli]